MAEQTEYRTVWKPDLHPKSAAVLAVAEEILRQKRGQHYSAVSLSDSEIYDDIVSLRKVDDDIYDDVVVSFMRMQRAGSDVSRVTKDRPQVPTKPAWLLSFQPPKLPASTTSYEDIYDDIVVQKMRAKSENATPVDCGLVRRKPQLPKKSSGLYNHPKVKELLEEARQRRAVQGTTGLPPSDVDMEDIYDDIISCFVKEGLSRPDPLHVCSMPRKDVTQQSSSFTAGHSQLVDESQLPSLDGGTDLPIQRDSHSESLYDNECVFGGKVVQCTDESEEEKLAGGGSTNSQPFTRKSKSLLRQAFSDRSQQRRVTASQYTRRPKVRLSVTSEEAILPVANEPDLTTTLQPHHPTAAAATSATLPASFRTAAKFDDKQSLLVRRCINDPLPPDEPNRFRAIKTWDSEDEDDTYEDLPLYEDVAQFQDDEHSYEHASSVVVKALNLPTNIRSRASRITLGERKHLKKKLRTARKRSHTLPSEFLSSSEYRKSVSPSPATPKAASPIREEGSGAMSPLSEEDTSVLSPITEKGSSAMSPVSEIGSGATPSFNEEGSGAVSPFSEEGSGDEDTSSAAIPFGKSRVVFEMLLDASGISRASTKEEQSAEAQASSPLLDQEKTADEAVNNSEKYQQFFDPSELDKLQEDPEIKRYREAGVITVRSKSDIAADIKELTADVPLSPPPLPGFQRSRSRVITLTGKAMHKRFLLRRQLSMNEAILKQSPALQRRHTSRHISSSAIEVPSTRPPFDERTAFTLQERDISFPTISPVSTINGAVNNSSPSMADSSMLAAAMETCPSTTDTQQTSHHDRTDEVVYVNTAQCSDVHIKANEEHNLPP